MEVYQRRGVSHRRPREYHGRRLTTLRGNKAQELPKSSQAPCRPKVRRDAEPRARSQIGDHGCEGSSDPLPPVDGFVRRLRGDVSERGGQWVDDAASESTKGAIPPPEPRERPVGSRASQGSGSITDEGVGQEGEEPQESSGAGAQGTDHMPEDAGAPSPQDAVPPPPQVVVKRGRIVFQPLHHVRELTIRPEWKKQAVRTYRVDEPLRILDFILGHHGFRQTRRDPNWTLWWTRGGSVRASMLAGLEPWQKVNHFPKTSELSRKDHLAENVCRMQEQYGLKAFDFLPKTFVLPRQQDALREYHEQEPESTYIVKPIGSSCGKGIYVTRDPRNVETEAGESVVVSRYLDKPLLIDGYKFDLRIYVAVTSFDPLRLYIYEEGLCRFASEKYDASGKSLTNSFVHLTNYSINKHNDKYIGNTDEEADSEGHKWSLTAFRAHLRDCGIDDGLLWERVHDIVVKAIISVEPIVRAASAMYQQGKNNCFELFGFDILIEENLRPWLLEVNLSPSLSVGSPLDRKVKGDAITDLLNLVGLDARSTKDTGRSNVKGKQQRPKRKHPKVRKEWEHPSGSQAPSKSSTLDEPKMIDVFGDTLTSDEKRILRTSQEELCRARQGSWQCLFPTRHSISYSGFFDGPRPLNALLAKLMWWSAGVEPQSAHARAVARNAVVPFWKEEATSKAKNTTLRGGQGSIVLPTPSRERDISPVWTREQGTAAHSEQEWSPLVKLGAGHVGKRNKKQLQILSLNNNTTTATGRLGRSPGLGLPSRNELRKLMTDDRQKQQQQQQDPENAVQASQHRADAEEE